MKPPRRTKLTINGNTVWLRALVCQEAALDWANQVREALADHSVPAIVELSRRLGSNNVRQLFACWPSEFRDYLSHFAAQLTEQRVVVERKPLMRAALGAYTAPTNFPASIMSCIDEVRQMEYRHQLAVFPRNEFDQTADVWTLYYAVVDHLTQVRLRFDLIKPLGIRNACKAWAADQIQFQRRLTRVGACVGSAVTVFGIICDRRPEVMQIEDITLLDVEAAVDILQHTKTQHGKLYAPDGIRHLIVDCRNIYDHACGGPPDSHYDTENPFTREFLRLEGMAVPIKGMPGDVHLKIVERAAQLHTLTGRLLVVLLDIGLRFKEAVRLKDDCLTREDDEWKLTYTPFKILEALIANGLPTTTTITIGSRAAAAILEQIAERQAERRADGVSFIFTKPSGLSRFAMPSPKKFADEVNRLIVKWGVTHNGEPWHFSAHQCRKTIGHILADEGASSWEISQRLNHLAPSTSAQYYVKVGLERVASLNSHFFEEQFGGLLADQGADASSNARACVLADLPNRQVELGFCTKPVKDGPCGRHVGQVDCATCPNLWSGPEYLPEWTARMLYQKNRLDRLTEAYEHEGLSLQEYRQFREYQCETRHHEALTKIVKTLSKGGNST